MGHFGTSSDANDQCWDVLGHCCPDPEREASSFPIDQAEADLCQAFIEGGFKCPDPELTAYYKRDDESDTVLGPVIWMLRERFKVTKPLLKRALAVAQARRRSKRYLQCWRDTGEREAALATEILILKLAIKDITP